MTMKEVTNGIGFETDFIVGILVDEEFFGEIDCKGG